MAKNTNAKLPTLGMKNNNLIVTIHNHHQFIIIIIFKERAQLAMAVLSSVLLHIQGDH